MENKPSFYGKQHVVFRRHSLFAWEGSQIGIRYEKLKINPYFCQRQSQDKIAMAKVFDAQLFLDIQNEADNYARALQELQEGQKRSHWIWYVFPQISGLGFSEMAQSFALDSLKEAQNYWAHPVLSARLRSCTEALLSHARVIDVRTILSKVDAQKVCSCMTLFDLVAPNNIFATVLEQIYNNTRCDFTLQRCDPNVQTEQLTPKKALNLQDTLRSTLGEQAE